MKMVSRNQDVGVPPGRDRSSKSTLKETYQANGKRTPSKGLGLDVIAMPAPRRQRRQNVAHPNFLVVTVRKR